MDQATPTTAPWFYVITLVLETKWDRTSATFRGTVNVTPFATPEQIYNHIRDRAEKAVLDAGGPDMTKAETIFYHAEPNRPVG